MAAGAGSTTVGDDGGGWIGVEMKWCFYLPNFPSSEKFPVLTKEGECGEKMDAPLPTTAGAGSTTCGHDEGTEKISGTGLAVSACIHHCSSCSF